VLTARPEETGTSTAVVETRRRVVRPVDGGRRTASVGVDQESKPPFLDLSPFGKHGCFVLDLFCTRFSFMNLMLAAVSSFVKVPSSAHKTVKERELYKVHVQQREYDLQQVPL